MTKFEDTIVTNAKEFREKLPTEELPTEQLRAVFNHVHNTTDPDHMREILDFEVPLSDEKAQMLADLWWKTVIDG